MSLIIANIFGWIVANWRLMLMVAGAIGVLVLLGLVMRSCRQAPAKIDEAQIQRINTANETERKRELQTIIEDNQDVIKTVDNRSAITEVNMVERNREIDAKVKEADRKIVEAKSQGRDVTQEELQCLLIPENCK